MKSFDVKDSFKTPGADEPIRKPSLNSVLDQKRRVREDEKRRIALKLNENYSEMEAKMMQEASDMSLVGHLGELRKRIIVCVIAVLVGFCLSYYFVDDILAILIAPAGKLYYMRPTEAFFTYMKVAMVSGIIIMSPILLYETLAFILPALTKSEKRMVNLFLPVAVILFILGVCFSYFLVLPAAVRFFIGFATDELEPLLSIGQYIDFIIAFIIPFGLIFELPVVLIILASLNLVSSAFLRKQRKIFILLAFIIGGAISPTPDIFSQCMIAFSMLLLYEVSLKIVGTFMRK